MTTTTTYNRKKSPQNNYITSMTIIPIHGVRKNYEKPVENKLMQNSGFFSVKETQLTELNGTWLVVTGITCKT